MRLSLDTPAGFHFTSTIRSHGWFVLQPFVYDERARRLESVVALPDGGARRIALTPDGRAVRLEVAGTVDHRARRHVIRAARRILNLDLDLTPFYAVSRDIAGMDWIAERGMGRLLRAPSVFEDLVKLILTTNCSWAFTKKMVAALVRRYGERATDGSRSFPLPRRMARVRERTYREHVRAGYRAAHLRELPRRVVRGELAPELWERDPRPVREIRQEILAVPGAGPYVAENVLRLLGRPDGLGLDTFLRSKYARVYHGGRPVTDRTIARRYARWGPWGGLALWCDMTRDW